MVPGLLLPLAGWAAEPPATGWQPTPQGIQLGHRLSGHGRAGPTPHGERHRHPARGAPGSWGLFISREVDDPGMVELLYSHQSTWVSPNCLTG